MIASITRSGFCPRNTPIDTLMAAPLAMHLAVAEELEDDGNHADDDLSGMTVLDDWEYV